MAMGMDLDMADNLYVEWNFYVSWTFCLYLVGFFFTGQLLKGVLHRLRLLQPCSKKNEKIS